jgi:tetratricopeptide (TPR) repeat protein
MPRSLVLRFYAAMFLIFLLITGCGGIEARKTKFYEKGKALYAQGEFIKAGLEFKNAVQIDPRFADAYYMLGSVELKKGDSNQAFNYFSRCTELNSDHYPAQIEMGKLFLLIRQPDKSLEKADLVLNHNPGAEDALLLKGAAWLDQKQYEKARVHLDGLIQQGVRRPDAFLLLAVACKNSGDAPGAEAALRSGMEWNPKDVLLLMRMAEACKESGNSAEALALAQKLIALEPDEAAHKLSLAGLYWTTGKEQAAADILRSIVAADPKSEEKRLQVGDFYLSRNRFGEAERELEEALGENGNSFKIRFMLSDLLAGLNRTDDAIQLLKDGLVLNQTADRPDVIQAKNALAKVYLMRGELDEAKKYVGEVLLENPQDVKAHFTKGNIHLAKKEGAAAVPDFRTVVNENPQFIPGYVCLAEAHALAGEWGLAADTLQNALKADGSSGESMNALIRVYIDQSKIPEAITFCEKRIQENPEKKAEYYYLGQMYELTGDYEKAIATYEKLVEKQPDHWAGVNNLAYLLSDHGRSAKDIAKAFALAHKANAAYPENANILDTLGWIYYKKGELKQGLDYLKKAHERNSESVGINCHLGMILDGLGRTGEAMAYLEKAVASNEMFYGKKACEKVLKR